MTADGGAGRRGPAAACAHWAAAGPGPTGRPQPATAGLISGPASQVLLQVNDLRIHFPSDDGLVKAVDGVSFTLERGKTLGIVGESGSGKSVTSLGLLGLHHGTRARIDGQIWLDGEELVTADPGRVRELRGRKMAMIFQDPLSSLHPYYTVGAQITEAYLIHNKVSKKAAREHAIEMLDRVGIPHPHSPGGRLPASVLRRHAAARHDRDGPGLDPELLIADEPTTALDVTVQAQILDLIADLQSECGSAIIMITHDLGRGRRARRRRPGHVRRAGSPSTARRRGHLLPARAPLHLGLLARCPALDDDRPDRLMPIPGTPPSLINVPSGCAFHPRCGYRSLTGGRSETSRRCCVRSIPATSSPAT